MYFTRLHLVKKLYLAEVEKLVDQADFSKPFFFT